MFRHIMEVLVIGLKIAVIIVGAVFSASSIIVHNDWIPATIFGVFVILYLVSHIRSHYGSSRDIILPPKGRK